MEVITNNNIKCTVALSGLYEVYDPEIGLNVVDLGLIYGINFDEERNSNDPDDAILPDGRKHNAERDAVDHAGFSRVPGEYNTYF